jgi:hypothetical protein
VPGRGFQRPHHVYGEGEEEEKGCGGMMLTEKGDEDGWRGRRSVTTEYQTSFNQRS